MCRVHHMYTRARVCVHACMGVCMSCDRCSLGLGFPRTRCRRTEAEGRLPLTFYAGLWLGEAPCKMGWLPSSPWLSLAVHQKTTHITNRSPSCSVARPLFPEPTEFLPPGEGGGWKRSTPEPRAVLPPPVLGNTEPPPHQPTQAPTPAGSPGTHRPPRLNTGRPGSRRQIVPPSGHQGAPGPAGLQAAGRRVYRAGPLPWEVTLLPSPRGAGTPLGAWALREHSGRGAATGTRERWGGGVTGSPGREAP